MKIWPRYKVAPVRGGMSVVDTWTKRTIMRTYGGTHRERVSDARAQAASSDYQAKRRVARLRRALIETGEVSKAAADRMARYLDADGIGTWDWWFS